MDEPRANIDLLFRNGLRDYEVLPPAEVWDNIHPSVRNNNTTVYLKAAALAIITSLTVLAYFLTSSGPVRNNLVSDLYINLDDPVRIPVRSYPSNPVHMPVLAPEFVTEEPKMIIPDNNDDSYYSVNELTIPFIGTSQTAQDYRIKKEEALNITIPDFLPNMDTYNLSPFNSSALNRWTLSAMVSPTYFSNFGSDNNASGQQVNSSEHAVISYTGGFSLSYRINRRFSIQTGLYYASLDRRVDGINSYAGFKRFNDAKGDHTFEIMTTSGPVYSSNADVYLLDAGQGERIIKGYASNTFDPDKANLIYINSSIRQNFSYLQMPLIVRYKFIDKTMDFNLIGGVSYDFLVDNAAYVKAGNTRYDVGTTKGINTLSFSSSLGMGMEYNFSDKISLNLEPTFHYYLNPFNQPINQNIHPYSFGIFSGFSYKF